MIFLYAFIERTLSLVFVQFIFVSIYEETRNFYLFSLSLCSLVYKYRIYFFGKYYIKHNNSFSTIPNTRLYLSAINLSFCTENVI